MYLKVYAVMLVIILVGLILFYATEYVRRGGRTFEAIDDVIFDGIVLLPLPVAVFLYASESAWVMRTFWLAYAVFLPAYGIYVGTLKRNRETLRRLRDNFVTWPVAGSVVLILLFLVLAPPYVILWVYALKR